RCGSVSSEPPIPPSQLLQPSLDHLYLELYFPQSLKRLLPNTLGAHEQPLEPCPFSSHRVRMVSIVKHRSSSLPHKEPADALRRFDRAPGICTHSTPSIRSKT